MNDTERGKQNLLKMLKFHAQAEALSDGELIDQCVEHLDDVCSIGDYPEALFNELLERFQKAIKLDITPGGVCLGGLIDAEEWQEEFISDDNL
ncbi:MAG: hypothetical protein JWM96_1332 [Alphaproteobacteria bacterium]|nr:hypothetical protein [Alphaproteobacteria bacterium]